MAKKNMFDLDGLDTYEYLFEGLKEEFPRLLKEYAKKEAEYVRKYGREEGLRRYAMYLVTDDTIDYDVDLKDVNLAVYCGAAPMSTNRKLFLAFEKRYEARMRELYGDRYEELKNHRRGDSRVVEILLQDALKTGKWKELPNQLHEEYKKRAGLV